MKLIIEKQCYLLSVITVLIHMILVQGCAKSSHSVIAATETTIGVNISQNPATQNPQAKLGYNRAEMAIVPTNRSRGDDAGNTNDGAKDVADVIMELRYGGIFDVGATSGIYQRLAVGANAVKEPGAAFMFSKDAAGNFTSETTNALSQAITPEMLSSNQLSAVDKIAVKVINSSGITDENKLKTFLKCAGLEESISTRYNNLKENDFKVRFSKDFKWKAEQYAHECAK